MNVAYRNKARLRVRCFLNLSMWTEPFSTNTCSETAHTHIYIYMNTHTHSLAACRWPIIDNYQMARGRRLDSVDKWGCVSECVFVFTLNVTLDDVCVCWAQTSLDSVCVCVCVYLLYVHTRVCMCVPETCRGGVWVCSSRSMVYVYEYPLSCLPNLSFCASVSRY